MGKGIGQFNNPTMIPPFGGVIPGNLKGGMPPPPPPIYPAPSNQFPVHPQQIGSGGKGTVGGPGNPLYKMCTACAYGMNLARYKWCNRCLQLFSSPPGPITGGRSLLTRQGPPYGKGPGPSKASVIEGNATKLLPTTYSDGYSAVVPPPSQVIASPPPVMTPPPGPPPVLPGTSASLPATLQTRDAIPDTSLKPGLVYMNGTTSPSVDANVLPQSFPPKPPPLPTTPPQIHPASVPRHDPPPVSSMPLALRATPPPPPLAGPPPQSPPEPAWKTAIVNCTSINLYQPSSWPNWFGKIIMIPKSPEAVF